jgi:predicted enzyme related to lactoylglutathione lyase
MRTLTGPDFISLQVSHLEASKAFYVNILGLNPSQENAEAIVFDTQPIALAIRKPLVDLNAVAQLGHGIAVWLKVNDVPAYYAHLKAHGVILLNQPTPSPFGLTLMFKDPDGYVLTLHDGA